MIVVLFVLANFNQSSPVEDPNAVKRNSLLEKLAGMELRR